MTRTVFVGAEVAHIFASRSQDAGRNSNGTFYFRGDTLYSYRDSAPLARFFGDVVLINDDRYSVTTSKHQSWARYALNQFDRITLPRLKDVIEILDAVYRAKQTDKESGKRWIAQAEKKALEYIESQGAAIAETEARIKKMRSEWKISQARATISKHEQACFFVWTTALGKRSDWRKTAAPELAKARKLERQARYRNALDQLTGHVDAFDASQLATTGHASPKEALWQMERDARGLTYADSLGARRGDGIGEASTWSDAKKLMGKAWIAAYRAQVAKLEKLYAPFEARIAKLRIEVDKLERIKEAEKLEAWLSGQSAYAPRLSRIACRVVGDEVQTSAGARVPLDDALRVVDLAKRCRANGEELKRDNIATGAYRGIRITSQGDVTIGCHSLPWVSISECVARFKPELADACS